MSTQKVIWLLLLTCLIVIGCRKDEPITDDDDNNDPQFTKDSLIGSWDGFTGCDFGGPYIFRKISFTDSTNVELYDGNYVSADSTDWGSPIAWGTYDIISPDTLRLVLLYDTSVVFIEDTNQIDYAIYLQRNPNLNIHCTYVRSSLTNQNNPFHDPLGAKWCKSAPAQYWIELFKN